MNVLIDLFDYSGNCARPYKENGWLVKQIEIKHGEDVLTWDYKKWFGELLHSNKIEKVGIIAAIPCTAYALCGNRHKKSESRKPVFAYSQKLVARTKEIIDYFESLGLLLFWQIENPSSDIHTHNDWLGKPFQKFNPCDFAGYDPNPTASRYNKKTWLWGKFKKMSHKRMEPFTKYYDGYNKLGGKSERTKELRSITPLGFCYAFYEHNN